MKSILRYILIAMGSHSCEEHQPLSFEDDVSLSDVLKQVSQYVQTIRKKCNHCYVVQKILSASDIAQLLVLDNRDNWTLSIDLNVYNSNQQFRLFDCVKFGCSNPLKLSVEFPFNQTRVHQKFEILRKSLITLFDRDEIFIINTQNEHWLRRLKEIAPTISNSSDKTSRVYEKKQKHFYFVSLFLTHPRKQDR